PLVNSPTRDSSLFLYTLRLPPRSTLFPYTTLFRSLQLTTVELLEPDDRLEQSGLADSVRADHTDDAVAGQGEAQPIDEGAIAEADRKSTRLNSSHVSISYAVFCLKKKKRHKKNIT